MVTRVATVAFQGIEAVPVDVQVQVAPGMPKFLVVGLPDKAVKESSERVRAALVASGLGLPPKRITVNLAPADLPKEGSHYDLPIALGLMAAIGAIPQDALDGYLVLGELGLDGRLAHVGGILPAAIAAQGRELGLICPSPSGPEAAWAGDGLDIVAVESLLALVNHLTGHQLAARPQPGTRNPAKCERIRANRSRAACLRCAMTAIRRFNSGSVSTRAWRMVTSLKAGICCLS